MIALPLTCGSFELGREEKDIREATNKRAFEVGLALEGRYNKAVDGPTKAYTSLSTTER